MSKSFHEIRSSGGIIKKVIKPAAAIGKGIKKVAAPVTNRLTRSGRAAIAQKKIDKHNTKVNQRDTIKKANAAGKSAFGFTQKQRAANAKKKLDAIAKRKRNLDTINRAKNLKRNVTAGTNYESTEEGKMKSFDQLRYELGLCEGYESSSAKKNAMAKLSSGASSKHTGHEGMASYHASMANKHKGTEAGKHHQRASDHHSRALNAIRKGNVNGGLTHAKNALDAAKAAHNSNNSRSSESGHSDSMELYHDHKSAANTIKQAKRRDDASAQKNKQPRSDKPVQRAIGKAKTKIKRALRREGVEEAKRTVTIDKPDRLTSLRVSKDKPPFDNAKPVNKDPKDKFGNPIKNRARYLARKAARNEDSDAVKAFLAKGGKIKKLPPAKAQGYHGKDDPGQGMHGMLDKPDTKKFKAKKGGKIRSMGSLRNQTEANATVDERNKANALARKNMDASRGSRFKSQNPNMTPASDPKHKTPRDQNKALGRALRTMGEKKYSVGADESTILDKVEKMIANTKNAPEAYKLIAKKMKVTDQMSKKLVNKVIDRSTKK